MTGIDPAQPFEPGAANVRFRNAKWPYRLTLNNVRFQPIDETLAVDAPLDKWKRARLRDAMDVHSMCKPQRQKATDLCSAFPRDKPAARKARRVRYSQAVYSFDLKDRCFTAAGASEIFRIFAHVCL